MAVSVIVFVVVFLAVMIFCRRGTARAIAGFVAAATVFVFLAGFELFVFIALVSVLTGFAASKGPRPGC